MSLSRLYQNKNIFSYASNLEKLYNSKYMGTKEEIGKKVKAVRESRKLTQAEVAEKGVAFLL